MSRLPSLGPRGEGWFALQMLLVGGIFLAGLFLGDQWCHLVGGITALAGGVLILVGIVLVVAAIAALGPSLSPLPRPRESPVFVESGVYRFVRHPTYAGLILLALGWSMARASWLALALTIALAVLLDLKARREEVWLRERFPDYAGYAGRTKRFMPRVY